MKKFTLLTTVASVMAFAGVAQAEQNEVFIEQIEATDSTILVTQADWTSHYASVGQYHTSNSHVELYQGVTRQHADIVQTGNHNVINAFQGEGSVRAGYDNTLNIHQANDGNVIDVFQEGILGVVEINQEWNNNHIDVYQAGDWNETFITQDADDSVVTVSQYEDPEGGYQFNSFMNVVDVEQISMSHYLEIHVAQTGENNFAGAYQYDVADNSRIDLHQSGFNNSMNVTQHGTAGDPARPHVAHVSQSGTGNYVGVNQNGF